MACALLRVVGIGEHLCQATALRQMSRIAYILKSSSRICSTVPKLHCSSKVLRLEDSSDLQIDSDTSKQVKVSVESLLKSITVKQLSGKDAANILTQLTTLARDENSINNGSPLLGDNRFVVLCSVVDKKVVNLNDATLIATLRALIFLGVPPNDPVIESVETQILWRTRKMNLQHLISLFVLIVNHQMTDLQQRILTDVQTKLQQRWFEVSDPREVLVLFRHSTYFRADFIHKLEDRVIDLVENGLSADELSRVFVTLADQQLRSTHLLRSITYHLTKHSQKLGFKQIANLMNSMSLLSYVDHALLQRLSDDLLADLPGIENPAHVAATVAAIGRLQWRHSALMEAFSDWFLKNIDRCSGSHFVAYVLTLARTQYGVSSGGVEGENGERNEQASTLLDTILSVVTKEKINGDIVWLNFVWSLAIIGRITLSQVRFVLDRSFYQDLLILPGYQSMILKKKLLNIHAVAKWELGHIESLSKELIGSQAMFDQTKNDALRTSVLETLRIYLPMGKFLKCNKWTQSGVFVDAEFVLDKDGKPLPLEDYSTYFGEVESYKPLPSSAHRMALLIQDFKDFTLNDVALTGLASLRIRVLKKSGYKVVVIPYSEYSIQAPTLKRLQYLQLTINNTIGIGSSTHQV